MLFRSAVDAPFGDAELPEVRPRVAGQSLAVLEVEAAELAARFGGWGSGAGGEQGGGVRRAPLPPTANPGRESAPSRCALGGGELWDGPVRRSRLQGAAKWDGGWWVVPTSLLPHQRWHSKKPEPNI